MPPNSKDRTRRKLQDAVVAETVEHGIAAISVAGIVKRARVSAGTVYVHFADKDDMLRQVYLQLKSEFHDSVTRGRDQADSAALVREMWFGMFDFVRARPQDFLFLEYASTAKLLLPEQQAVADGYAADIAALLRRGVEDGTLAPLEDGLLSLLLVAPALHLARGAVIAGQPITTETITRTFERVWLSIANTQGSGQIT
ncbi:TetR/AcrR family transcriptional regulator [Roseivivax sp. GX 12232]|uniref:TetR/AcrR family transcriptional regulator n=1 Tax=Roseivivax sp. GX 12232 TaxID=2900547 RepID=UPI001E2B95C3|nr:TetR/AcrR family transcriptional regulator [Roseivivax sp. GX 12232]MCE0505187.1 TetR/AcrR family transcriptional regulator [Roseivivax sp. GX 12232]